MKTKSFLMALAFLPFMILLSCGSLAEQKDTGAKQKAGIKKGVSVPEPVGEYEINEFLKAVAALPGKRDAWNGKIVTVTGTISKNGVFIMTEEGSDPYYLFDLIVNPENKYKAWVADWKEPEGFDSLFHVVLTKKITTANLGWKNTAGEVVKIKAEFQNGSNSISLSKGELVK